MARLVESPENGDSGEAAPSSELWTLQEEAQGVAPSYQFVPLTRRPASFSFSARAGSFDTGTPSPAADNSEDLSSKAGNEGDDTSCGGPLVNGEGFPLLLRRRTFTEPSLLSKRRCCSSADDGVGRGRRAEGGGGGPAGRRGVPVSVSEDNMLSLLSKRSSRALEARRRPSPTEATTPNKLRERRDMAIISSSSVSNSSSSSSSSDDADSEGIPMQEERPSPASERARRNEFVIRYARMEDAYSLHT